MNKGRLAIALGAGVVVTAVILAAVFLRPARTDPRPFLERPKEFRTDYVANENMHDEAMGSVKKQFMKSMKEMDFEKAKGALTADFRGRFPRPDEGRALPDKLLALREYSPEGLKDLNRDEFIAVLKSHLDGWSKVERNVWRTFEFLNVPDGKSAFISVHFQLAGRKPDASRAQLDATIRGWVVKQDDGTWKVRELGLAEGFRADASFPPFADVTDLTGFTLNESEARLKLIQSVIDDRALLTRGGLVAADFNRDGHVDVLASDYSAESVLFMNDGRGGFVRGAPPVSDPRETGYTWLYVDLDNDGTEELVGSQVLSYEGGKGRFGVYIRRDGRWVLDRDALVFDLGPADRGLSVTGAVAHDIDGNGFLDLYVMVYSNQGSKQSAFNRLSAFDGARDYLFMNHGGLKFTEEAAKRGIVETQYTYVVKFWDFDGDGDEDLFHGNDWGINHLFQNQGDATYKDLVGHPFNRDSHYTMGVTIADWDNTGRWDMYVSSMYSHAGNRIIPLVQDGGEFQKVAMLLAQGNVMYEGGDWKETGVSRGVNWADWAWACLFYDYDNDADRDLFVANGYTTHQDASAPDY